MNRVFSLVIVLALFTVTLTAVAISAEKAEVTKAEELGIVRAQKTNFTIETVIQNLDQVTNDLKCDQGKNAQNEPGEGQGY